MRFRLVPLIVLFAACASPSATPVATVELVSEPATATSALTATVVPPTATSRPTATAQPTATRLADRQQIIKDLSDLMREAGASNLTIADVRYAGGTRGPKTIFHVDVQYTAAPFDEGAAGSVVGVIAGYLQAEPALKPDLVAFNVIVSDAKQKPQQTVVGEWQDLADYSAGHLSSEQFVKRLIMTGSVAPTAAPTTTKPPAPAAATRTPRPAVSTNTPLPSVPTNTPLPPPPTLTWTPAAPQANCDLSYPTVCIAPPPPDLNCTDIPYRKFTVLPPDSHGFDKDGDGIGCES